MNQNYRAYVKDCLHLNDLPKSFMTILSGDVACDILTRASSSFDCLDKVPDDVKEGDIFCLYTPSGRVVYQGVITAIEDKRIQTAQIQSLFDHDWFTRNKEETYLESEVADVFTDFMSGKIGEIVTSLPAANKANYYLNKNYFVLSNGAYTEYIINQYEDDNKNITYQMDNVGTLAAADISQLTDPLIVQKYSAFTVTKTNSQTVHLTSPDRVTDLRNLESFIYSLYDSYGVLVEITIPYQSGCNINIKTADYAGTVISTNASSILSISPKTETEEINKLVVFGQNGNFRKTYYATPNGITNNGSDSSRLRVINTTYIYSDDNLNDIKTENLKDSMYNHEIVFNMIIDNNLYDFYDWKFGMPLEVHYKTDVYESVYTGYSYYFANGEFPSIVEIKCGTVRTKLTDKINMNR